MRACILSLAVLPAACGLAGEPPPDPGWEEVEAYKKHYDRVTDDLAEEVNTLGGKVLLVWIIDGSRSMDDDVAAIRDRVQRLLDAVDRRRVALQVAALVFGETAKELVPPIDRPDRIVAGLAQARGESRGVENCMAAIRSAVRRYAGRGGRTLLVLVSDERGDDEQKAEEALEELKAAGMRLYCLGRESPFAADQAQEIADPLQPPVFVRAGPESPELEALPIWVSASEYAGPSRARAPDVPSGFGNYAQARLCRETGGKYYPYRSGAMRLLNARYDEELLREYAPSLLSRREYRARAEEIPMQRACRAALVLCAGAPVPVLHRIGGTEDPFGMAPAGPPWLEEVRGTAKRRRKALEEALQLLQDGRGGEYDEPLPKRIQANAQLLEAQLRFGIYEMQALGESAGGWLKRPEARPRKGEMSVISWSAEPGAVSGGGEEALKLKAGAEAAFARLQAEHAGTPWEEMARAHHFGGFRIDVHPVVVRSGPAGPDPPGH